MLCNRESFPSISEVGCMHKSLSSLPGVSAFKSSTSAMLVRDAGDGQLTPAVSLWSAFFESPRRSPCCFIGQVCVAPPPLAVSQSACSCIHCVRSRARLMQKAMFRLAVTATLRQTLASGRLCFLEKGLAWFHLRFIWKT